MKHRQITYFLCLLGAGFIALGQRGGALSTGVVIQQVQTGGTGSGAASEELVLVKNVSPASINITDWCVQYSAATNGTTFTTLGCAVAPSPYELWLEPDGLASFATSQFLQKNASFQADFTLSAGMAAGGGHIRLIDGASIEVDRVGWGTATTPEGGFAAVPQSGSVLGRRMVEGMADTDDNAVDFESTLVLTGFSSGVYEVEISVDVCLNLDGMQFSMPEGYMLNSEALCLEDRCWNLEDLQVSVPAGYDEEPGYLCQEIVFENRPLLITEILPNAPSFDDGLEFIELYNPNDTPVPLKGYSLALGPDFTKEFVFPAGEIMPGHYVTITDSESGLVLPNGSASVRLMTPGGTITSETPSYRDPGEGLSWALVGEVWVFTNQVTPATANKQTIEAEDEPAYVQAVTVLAPCPVGKTRNPDTNRCRTTTLSVTALESCPSGQYRNPATNRCKSLTIETAASVPCKEGQERNPDTNRCRSIAGISKELVPCDEGEERNPETHRCRKVAAASEPLQAVKDIYTATSSGRTLNVVLIATMLMCAIGYVCYEWRHEISHRLLGMRSRIGGV